MAKTIKEMANKYVDEFYARLGITQAEFPTDALISKNDFISGANAVLECILECIEEFSNTEDYSIVLRLIKALKGE